MKASEFKAWFEGFSEGIGKLPNAKQWSLIRERAESIESESQLTVWGGGYLQPWYPTWYPNTLSTFTYTNGDCASYAFNGDEITGITLESTAFNIGRLEAEAQ